MKKKRKKRPIVRPVAAVLKWKKDTRRKLRKNSLEELRQELSKSTNEKYKELVREIFAEKSALELSRLSDEVLGQLLRTTGNDIWTKEEILWEQKRRRYEKRQNLQKEIDQMQIVKIEEIVLNRLPGYSREQIDYAKELLAKVHILRHLRPLALIEVSAGSRSRDFPHTIVRQVVAERKAELAPILQMRRQQLKEYQQKKAVQEIEDDSIRPRWC